MSPDDETWYPARIKATNDDGTWVVEWDDPDGGPETNNLGETSIKKLYFHRDYKVGDDCKAESPDDGRWYPGVVAKVLGEGKFTVKWDDPDEGHETDDLNFEVMKKQRIKKDYKKGDEVIARFPEDGNMYEAVVLEENKDGTFQVKWDDPDGGPEDSPVNVKQMRIRPILIEDLKVGDPYHGTITGVRDSWAFVDIGAEGNGFLHISRISEERIEDIYAVLEEDQEIDVWISGVRPEEGKFGLTMVEGKVDPPPRIQTDYDLFADVDPSEFHDGVVVNVRDFGAFVRITLEDGTMGEGLVPKGMISDEWVDDINDYVKVGQEVKVRVDNVDLDMQRMRLSMKEGGGGFRAPREIPDLTPFEGVSGFIPGKVIRIASFGAFVEVTAPGTDVTAQGLVHISAVKSEDGGFIENIEDHIREGEDIQVRVTNVDVMGGKLGLSMKDEEPEEQWD